MRRDSVVVLKLSEILLAQPVQRCAVHLRSASDEVSERQAGRPCHPRRTTCPARRSGCRRTPPPSLQFELARKPVATLEQEDAFPGRRKVVGERAPTRARPDDDDVVVVHRCLLRRCSRRRWRWSWNFRQELGEDDARGGFHQREVRRPAGSCRGAGRCRASNSSAQRPSGGDGDAQEPLHQVACTL